MFPFRRNEALGNCLVSIHLLSLAAKTLSSRRLLKKIRITYRRKATRAFPCEKRIKKYDILIPKITLFGWSCVISLIILIDEFMEFEGLGTETEQ